MLQQDVLQQDVLQQDGRNKNRDEMRIVRLIVGRLWAAVFSSMVFYAAFAMLAGCSLVASDRPASACRSAIHHQFDFWVGDWDVFDAGSPGQVAHARIDSILDDCVLREDYVGTDGHEGQSFTVYDSSRNVWHQTWVTSGGALLEIEGKFENGEMTLSGTNQKNEMVRGVWQPANGEVRETAEKSVDHGRSWQPWFDIVFRRADGGSHSAADAADASDARKVVAALDTQYQEAVKKNDAAAMSRILADDFVLVTSSGKTYTKADLLDEARNARRIYEHQEDTDKTVRVWGDTAIVTAKLWEKGTEDGKPFDHRLWFSDVYRRTATGWQYVFAQSAYRPGESIP